MTTDRQLDANRLNALKSTGPRTAKGKSRATANALKHGLAGRQVVLASESSRQYNSFRAFLLKSLDPHDGIECSLADQVVAASWRLRRVPILEATLHRRGRHNLDLDRLHAAVDQLRTTETENLVASLTGNKVLSEPYKKAQHILDQAETEKMDLFLSDPLLRATRILDTAEHSFLNLWRHERALTRCLHSNLHELQRLQAARAGEIVPPPAVLDVNLNATGASIQPCGVE
jgi:hypothetical protein